MASSLLIDIRPASGAHGQRGIGRYVRGLVACIDAFPEDLRSRIWAVGPGGPTLESFGAQGITSANDRVIRSMPTWLQGRIAMGRALRTSGAQVLHATDPQSPWIPRTRSLVTVYDLILLREPAILESLRPDNRYMYRRYLRQIQAADRVLAISRGTADDVEQLLRVAPDRIDVVYPLVVPPTGLVRDVAAEPTFLVVGALDAHKQPELALRAFAQFRGRVGSGRLRLIGPSYPAEERRLHEMAAELGVSGSLSIEGRISDGDLEAAFSTATALVSTSRIEGFGLPPVEAALRGVPVIAVETPAATETLTGVATFVSADAEAIADAMSHPAQPASSAIDAIRERYSIASVARSLAAAYGTVLD